MNSHSGANTHQRSMSGQTAQRPRPTRIVRPRLTRMQQTEPIDLGVADTHLHQLIGFVMESNHRMRQEINASRETRQQLLRVNRLLRRRIMQLEERLHNIRRQPITRIIHRDGDSARIIIESYGDARNGSQCDSSESDHEFQQMLASVRRQRELNTSTARSTSRNSDAEASNWSSDDSEQSSAHL